MNNPQTLVYEVAKDKTLYAYDYPRPSVTVDLVVIAERENTWSHMLFIRRGGTPYKGHLALPGGFLNIKETGLEAVTREFREECSTDLPFGCHPHFFKVADAVDRDPRGRVISLVYLAIFKGHPFPVKGSDDAVDATWLPLHMLKREDFAFDHDDIIDDVLRTYPRLTENCGMCNRTNCHNCPCR